MLHPEAALLQEILSGVAKTQRRSLVIDGSLSDCGWFGKQMKQWHEDGYDCEILFVVRWQSFHSRAVQAHARRSFSRSRRQRRRCSSVQHGEQRSLDE